MHGSREIEVTRKTKFRHGHEKDFRKDVQKKPKHNRTHNTEPSNGFDMWEDEPNDGC